MRSPRGAPGVAAALARSGLGPHGSRRGVASPSGAGKGTFGAQELRGPLGPAWGGEAPRRTTARRPEAGRTTVSDAVGRRCVWGPRGSSARLDGGELQRAGASRRRRYRATDGEALTRRWSRCAGGYGRSWPAGKRPRWLTPPAAGAARARGDARLGGKYLLVPRRCSLVIA